MLAGLVLGAGAALDEEADHVQVAALGRAVERQPLVVVLDVAVRALAQQHLAHLEVAVGGRDVEAGAALSVLHLDHNSWVILDKVYPVELETKVMRRFAKISQSWRKPTAY